MIKLFLLKVSEYEERHTERLTYHSTSNPTLSCQKTKGKIAFTIYLFKNGHEDQDILSKQVDKPSLHLGLSLRFSSGLFLQTHSPLLRSPLAGPQHPSQAFPGTEERSITNHTVRLRCQVVAPSSTDSKHAPPPHRPCLTSNSPAQPTTWNCLTPFLNKTPALATNHGSWSSRTNPWPQGLNYVSLS